MQSYSVVIDASDNPSTRYLVNDACIMTKLPLVSGSAVGMEGQLTVYNYKGGPCYRCLFPEPPPPNTVSNCGDAGVLGPGKQNFIYNTLVSCLTMDIRMHFLDYTREFYSFF